MKKKKQNTPKKSDKKDERPPTLVEMQELSGELNKAREMRKNLVAAIQQNPTEDLTELLANLDDAIEDGMRRLSTLSAVEIRRQLKVIGGELAKSIENCDDEEFLRLGEESEPMRFLREYEAQREPMLAGLGNLHPDDKPAEIAAEYERLISDIYRRLREKRERAEKRFPHLRKEYEMDESYNKALADLLYAIEQRDILAEAVRIAPPESRAEGLELLEQLDKSIERGEQALAKEYETFQNYARQIDDLRDMFRGKSPAEIELLRAYCRKNPGKLDEVEKLLAEEFPEPKTH